MPLWKVFGTNLPLITLEKLREMHTEMAKGKTLIPQWKQPILFYIAMKRKHVQRLRNEFQEAKSGLSEAEGIMRNMCMIERDRERERRI